MSNARYPRGEVQITAVDVQNMEGEYFSFSGELPTVPEGDSVVIEIVYQPQELGYHLAEVTISSETVEPEITVLVRGQAAEAIVSFFPPLVDFGPVSLGSSGPGKVTLVNEGEVAVSLTDATFDSDVFGIEEPLPLDLAGGAETSIALFFIPQDRQPAQGALQLLFDLPDLQLSPVLLRGNDCQEGDIVLYDQDGDGYSVCGRDCDDQDAASHPGATEVYDGVDNDCDGTIDEGTEGYDDDGDGYTELDGDCSDGDPSVNPGAQEDWSNGIDDDCDGTVDSDMPDHDGDGYAEAGGDCDDYDAYRHLGAEERADSVDNDCDGTIDEGTSLYDDDGDGFTETGDDCDDSDVTVWPGAPERADWTDNDCDGTVDEGTAYADDDGDGWTEYGGDCDDSDSGINPGAQETVGDGVDNDCDGRTQ